MNRLKMREKEKEMSCYYDASSTSFLGDMVQGDMQVIYEPFLERMPERGIILDVGCGSGRDSLYFKDQGHMVVAMETSEQICEMAGERIGQSVLFCRFQDAHFKVRFDGIWASGSLIHYSKEELTNLLKRYYWDLKDSGIIYLSFMYGEYEGEIYGAFYLDLTEEKAKMILTEAGFKVDKMWTTEHKNYSNVDICWLNIIAKK